MKNLSFACAATFLCCAPTLLFLPPTTTAADATLPTHTASTTTTTISSSSTTTSTEADHDVLSEAHPSTISSTSYLRKAPPPSPLSSAEGLRLLQQDDAEQGQCSASCCEEFYPRDCPDSASENPLSSLSFPVQILMIIVLLALSALFSGLTLGLMSLDKTGLEIVMEGDDAQNAAYAKRIYPIRQNGNLLLCTLLLGNVSVNALLSILLADKAGGTVGLLASTFLIVIFGEIVPQAACSRYALRIGSLTIPLVRIIVLLFYPIAKPLAFSLDWALGAELATTYSSAEMLKLLQIHVQEQILDPDTAVTMTGALQYKDKTVKEVMTPLENTYMLSVDERLNFETVASIFKTGYSRIPVYEINKNNIIGLLFVKDLIFIDPEDETRLADFVDIFGRGLHVVWPDDKLGDVLRELKQGRSHMAIVRDVNNVDETQDPFYEIKGIITLEDIIEEILGDEIVDETDAFVDGTHEVKVDRTEVFQWARLRLLHSKIVDATLSYDETRAVTAHLSKNYSWVVYPHLTENQLTRLIAETPVSVFPTATQEIGQKVPSDLIYEKGVASDVCTLILSGKVAVLAGRDSFRSDLASWALLAPGAIEQSDYVADFTAFVSSGPCRCLRLTRDRYLAAVDASILERQSSGSSSDINGSNHYRSNSQLTDPQNSDQSLPSQVPSAVTPGDAPSEAEVGEQSRQAKFLTALQVAPTHPGSSQEGMFRSALATAATPPPIDNNLTSSLEPEANGGNGASSASQAPSSKDGPSQNTVS